MTTERHTINATEKRVFGRVPLITLEKSTGCLQCLLFYFTNGRTIFIIFQNMLFSFWLTKKCTASTHQRRVASKAWLCHLRDSEIIRWESLCRQMLWLFLLNAFVTVATQRCQRQTDRCILWRIIMCIIEPDLRNKKPSCCLLRDEADDRQIKSPWSTDARVNDPKKWKMRFCRKLHFWAG